MMMIAENGSDTLFKLQTVAASLCLFGVNKWIFTSFASPIQKAKTKLKLT